MKLSQRVRQLYSSRCRAYGCTPWSPAQLTELAAWYEADPAHCWQDAGCTVACGDGDPIYIWLDRSGNGYHLTQSDILNRPTLRLVSGKWCVRFDGVNDKFVTGAPILFFPNKRGAIWAAIESVSSVGRTIATTYSGSAPDWQFGSGSAPANYGMFYYDGAAAVYVTSAAGNRRFIHNRTGDTAREFIDNGVVVDTSAITNNQVASNVLHVGGNSLGSEVLDADLYCLGMTDLQLSASEITKLDQYLAALMP